jgi:transposase
MEKKLFQPHYSKRFKRKVIEEYLATGCTKMSLLRKYNIQFKSAIQTWMRRLGYTDPLPSASRQPPKLKFGKIILTSLPKNKKQSQTDFEKKIRELERQLEDEKLRSEAYARIIEIAEKEYKIPIRKKPNTR